MAVEHIQYEYNFDSEGKVPGVNDNKDTGKQADTDKDLKPDFKTLVWLVLFVMGGGLLSMYYASIGYFPQVEWQETLLFLGLMAIFGSFFVMVFAALLYVPGRIWCTLIICDPYLKRAFHYGPEQDLELCLRSVWQYIARPFTVYSVALHLLLLAVGVSAALNPEVDLYGLLFIAALLALVFPSRWFHDELSGLLRPPKGKRALNEGELSRHRAKLMGFFFLSMLSGLVAVWIINRINVPRAGTLTLRSFFDRTFLAIVCTTIVLCANVFVAIVHEKYPHAARTAAFLGAFTLLICGDLLIHERGDRLSARTLSSYGVGYGHTATLLVKNDACRILTGGECPKDIPLKVKADILSRLGAEYFVLAGGRTFALPKSDVLAWSEREPLNETN